MLSDNKIPLTTKIIADDSLFPRRPIPQGPLLFDVTQFSMDEPRGYQSMTATMNYKPLTEKPLLHQNKFFGNKSGLSLETVVMAQKRYIKTAPDYKEHFIDNLPNQKVMRKKTDSWPYKYYKNDSGISLEKMVESKDKRDINIANYKEDFKGGAKLVRQKDLANRRSWPLNYNRNDIGISLEKMVESKNI